eukprot:NODE_1899_length_1039_cov_108.632323_g1543_i0.p2 GENE.NODE_1899_length_1039_cov_108.632323_g1543_i0~~NODE_1899_length_1039_cov_108.632323_g1543_i0.p2  ORF type:complete len:104 (-),score=30.15 NODE_1899_length_1039_cov_108.632323_g1543_i0:691-1002(-)
MSEDQGLRGKPYNKKYLPGYTGHVPFKFEQIAMTAGDVNRHIMDATNSKSGATLPVGGTHEQHYYRPVTQQHVRTNRSNKDVFGNHSKKAVNWMCGPTHKVVQ